MEIASAVAGEASKSIVSHLEREIGYLVHFNRSVEDLKTKIDQLKGNRDVVQRLIDAAISNNQEIRKPVQTWLQKVETVLEEATQLSDEAGLVNSCFKGWCCARFTLGRKATKKNFMIQALLDERNVFGDIVSNPKPTQSLEIVSDGDFDAFASRESTTKQIIGALKDGEIGLVGVFGMPGVGKTMLMETLSNQMKKDRLFDEVVIVTVSQYPELEKIQDDIAKGLDLRFGDEDTSFTRKAKLSKRISQGKKTLIILDDLWERLEIAKVGIPCKTVNKDCKVVFTTRDRGVCGRMESDVNIEVTVLTAEDSWRLFRERAGDIAQNCMLPAVAKDIANECKGLPLAIATLGRALRGKEESIWDSALRLLRTSIFGGMTPVFSSIKLSYDFLPNEESKMSFLICCLFPEDYKIDIDNIFYFLKGERFLRKAATFMEAKSVLHLVVDELVSSCLLLRNKDGYIMMHDIIRDVAISIASVEDNGVFVRARTELTEWPDVEFGHCKRLSLMNNKITCFPPYQIKAPNLLTLCLNKNSKLKDIPSDFFDGMQNLMTLDLSRTQIRILPPSFSCLKNLRTFLMEDCSHLVNISSIESLEQLEILSLHGYNRIESWVCIGKLTTLKMLDISMDLSTDLKSLRPFPPKVISSLYRLEELRFNRREIIEGEDQIDAGISEITSLTRLTSLRIILPVGCIFQEVPSHWEKLTEFMFLVAGEYTYISAFINKSRRWKRSMCLRLPSISIPNWILVLSKMANCLFLEECDHLKSVVQLDPRGRFNNLKLLHVFNISSMRYLFKSSGKENSPEYAFRNLEKLHLIFIYNLVAFCHGILPQGFFQNLRVLKMFHGHGVSTLIPCDLLERLQNLESLKVQRLMTMTKLVQLGGSTANTTQPISSSDTIPKFSSRPSFPIFPKLRKLCIEFCYSLEYLLPMRVLRELGQLELLSVGYNSNMVMIVEHENYEHEEDNADKDKAIMPRLKSLTLKEETKLSSFCRPNLFFDWPSLEYLEVFNCPGLKKLPLGTYSATKLRRLDIEQQLFNELEWEDESIKSRLQPLIWDDDWNEQKKDNDSDESGKEDDDSNQSEEEYDPLKEQIRRSVRTQ
ncbi:hypothetical protein AQUCO_08600047v1, partial [Aquilegia coerulea]